MWNIVKLMMTGIFLVAVGTCIFAAEIDHPIQEVSGHFLSIFMWIVGGLLGAISTLLGAVYTITHRRIRDQQQYIEQSVERIEKSAVERSVHLSEMASHRDRMDVIQREIREYRKLRDRELDLLREALDYKASQELVEGVQAKLLGSIASVEKSICDIKEDIRQVREILLKSAGSS